MPVGSKVANENNIEVRLDIPALVVRAWAFEGARNSQAMCACHWAVFYRSRESDYLWDNYNLTTLSHACQASLPFGVAQTRLSSKLARLP